MTDIKSLAKRYNFSDFTEKHYVTLIKLAKKKNTCLSHLQQKQTSPMYYGDMI